MYQSVAAGLRATLRLDHVLGRLAGGPRGLLVAGLGIAHRHAETQRALPQSVGGRATTCLGTHAYGDLAAFGARTRMLVPVCEHRYLAIAAGRPVHRLGFATVVGQCLAHRGVGLVPGRAGQRPLQIIDTYPLQSLTARQTDALAERAGTEPFCALRTHAAANHAISGNERALDTERTDRNLGAGFERFDHHLGQCRPGEIALDALLSQCDDPLRAHRVVRLDDVGIERPVDLRKQLVKLGRRAGMRGQGHEKEQQQTTEGAIEHGFSPRKARLTRLMERACDGLLRRTLAVSPRETLLARTPGLSDSPSSPQ